MILKGVAGGCLEFTSDSRKALAEAELVWVAVDTPVDEQDRADVAFVESGIVSLFPHLREGATVLISSQVPVGTTGRMEAAFRDSFPNRDVGFAYSPENLRLGKAIDVFRSPGRIVIGTRREVDRQRLAPVLAAICENLIWMSPESAEMTKHALNAFLANSIAFINEIAGICEEAGADAKEVEQGLKSDERIGSRAYLGAGGPYAGGTLARDIAFLISQANRCRVPVPLLQSIQKSNDLHKEWSRRKLQSLLGDLPGKRIAVLGLTYKPGTDTLRRSAAVELCQWLHGQGAQVKAFDPAVRTLPGDMGRTLALADSPLTALEASDAVVVATEWPDFRELATSDLIARMRRPIVLDANRFLESSLRPVPPLIYVAVGKSQERPCS